MGRAKLEPGARVLIDGVQHHFVRKVSTDTWHLEQSRTKRPIEVSERELLRKLANGTLVFETDALLPSPRPQSFDPDDPLLAKAKLRLSYVLAVEGHPTTKSIYELVILEVWRKHGGNGPKPSFGSVYSWVKKYRRSLSDIRSLVDNHAARGNRDPRFEAEVVAICTESIELKYLCPERGTIQDVLDHALMQVKRRNSIRLASDRLKEPTRRLIKRMINALPAVDVHVARHGHDAARHLYRGVKGHTISSAPMEVAECDNTVLDVNLVDERPNILLGRPYCTVIIDHYSRYVLGVEVGFEPPSFMPVARCLKNASRPKTDLNEQYPSITSDWNAYGLMRQLNVDNGSDFASEALELACQSFGVELRSGARKTPWFKPIIERFFGTLNREVCHKLPGSTFSNIVEKGDYDSEKAALLTLKELKELITKWICDVYHQRPHRTLGVSPAQAWASSIQFEDVFLPTDLVELDAVLRVPHTRKLTHKGVEYEGLLYNSPELVALRSRQGHTFAVDIRVDEGDLGAIFVLPSRFAIPLRVPCLQPEYASGLSLWRHKVYKNYAAQQREGATSTSDWLEGKEAIHQRVQELRASGKRRGAKRVGRLLTTEQPSIARPPLYVAGPVDLNVPKADPGFQGTMLHAPKAPTVQFKAQRKEPITREY